MSAGHGFARLLAYAAEVLSFDWKALAQSPALPTLPEPAALAKLAARCLSAFEHSGRPRLTLLGLGSGALAQALAQALPAGTLCVCEQDLGLVRNLRAADRLGWWRADGPAGLAVDASPWALLFLLDQAGFGPGQALVLANPELPPRQKTALRPLELLLTRSRPVAAPLPSTPSVPSAGRPRLSACAILAPAEPGLPEFFAQFPDWIDELVLVWDAAEPPGIAVPERFPVRQLARPLNCDFAAQRNVMLAACSGDWVFYLDADERLDVPGWAALPGLCAVPGVAGWHFPRLTPYPGPDRVLTGFGLWPDVQLRLFRNAPGISFMNPVHERLAGLSGGLGLALSIGIEHLSRLRKSPEELRRKFAVFDAASGSAVRHALSVEYPSVQRELLCGAPEPDAEPRLLLLPPELG